MERAPLNGSEQQVQQAQSGLIHPGLHDVAVAEIFPKLGTANLVALRGVCTYLCDLLDSDAISHFWEAATSQRLLNRLASGWPQIRCSHLQEQSKGDPPGDVCGQCVQAQLRGQAAELQATRMLRANYSKVVQSDEWYNQHDSQPVKYILWSPCSTWVAIAKENSFESHLPGPDQTGKPGTLTDDPWANEPQHRRCSMSKVTIINTVVCPQHVDWETHQGFPKSTRGCRSAGWSVTDLQTLPCRARAAHGKAWFVFTNQSPVMAGMFKCGLVCLDASENSMEEILGLEGQCFEVAADACKAAVYGGHGDTVDFYKLPLLQKSLTVKEGDSG